MSDLSLKAILSFNLIYCGFADRIAFDLCTSVSFCGSGYIGSIAVETLFILLLNIGPIVGWGISNPRSPHLNLSWQGTKTEGKCVENMCRVPNGVGQCCPYNVPWLNKPLSQKTKNCVLSSFTCLGSDLGSASPDKEMLNLTLQKQTPLCKFYHSCCASIKRHCMCYIFSINQHYFVAVL